MNALQDIVERTVTGMGYDLVEVELAGRGLMRVTIDLPALPGAVQAGAIGDLPLAIKVEDCERVSHQLTHVFEVEGIEYARLEVSSPGVDRPLRKPADFDRFAGHLVTVRLRAPFMGRRQFEGLLCRAEEGVAGWVLELDQPSPPVARRPGSGKPVREPARLRSLATAARLGTVRAEESAGPDRVSGPECVVTRLSFTLDEVERARLVPMVKF